MLHDFDPYITNDYLEAVQSFFEDVRKATPRNIEWLYQDLSQEPYAFIITLDEPLFLHLSHPISRFARARKYTVFRDDVKLCFDLALVPAYLVSLNIYTVIRLWSEGARRFFSPTSGPLSEQEEIWALYPQRGGAQFSSMNFVIRRNADIRLAPKGLEEVIKNYFNYFFWPSPRRGFSSCAHFIHGSRNISTMFKVAKSIYSVKGIYDDRLLIGSEELLVKRAVVSGLIFDDSVPKFVISKPVLTSDIFHDMEEYRERKYFINGVVCEFRRKGQTKFNTLTVVAEYGVNEIELLKALIGIVIWRRFMETEHVSKVGKIEEIKKDVYELLDFLAKRVTIDRTLAIGISDTFEYALSLLYPNIVYNKDVYFSHPFLFSMFEKYNLTERITSKKTNLLSSLTLLDKISISKESELYNSKEAEVLQNEGIFKQHIITALKEAFNWITISRKIYSNLVDKKGAPSRDETLEAEEIFEEETTSSGMNICPKCNGEGTITEIEYARQNGLIIPVTRSKKCPVCNGKGILNMK